jgi:hypothetical protein
LLTCSATTKLAQWATGMKNWKACCNDIHVRVPVLVSLFRAREARAYSTQLPVTI